MECGFGWDGWLQWVLMRLNWGCGFGFLFIDCFYCVFGFQVEGMVEFTGWWGSGCDSWVLDMMMVAERDSVLEMVFTVRVCWLFRLRVKCGDCVRAVVAGSVSARVYGGCRAGFEWPKGWVLRVIV